MTNVFVYGTLKSGQSRHHALEHHGPGKPAVTVQLFHMKRAAWPFIKPDAHGNRVKGELYSVDEKTLRVLDAIEGYPNLFTKQRIHVTLEDNTQEEATVYVIGDWPIPSYFTDVIPNEAGLLVFE